MVYDPPSSGSDSAFEFDVGATARTAMRMICFLAGLAVAGIGVYCGWTLFDHVKSVITDGKPLESAVDALSTAIHAEKLNVENPQTGVKMELGRSMAVGLVWMFYLPAMWISLGFIKAGASLISTAMSDNPKRR